MKVIILKTNEVKEVAPGYARNYLFPNKLAKPATEDLIKEAEHFQKQKADNQAHEVKQTDSLLGKLDKLTVKIDVKASEEGGLFAALTEKEVVKNLKNQHQVEIKEEFIKFDEPIKKIGEHSVVIDTGSENKGKLKIELNSAK